jgi:sulfate/thiosulfate transport system ATP-binding protein
MSIFENIAFGLRVRPRKLRPSNTEIRDKVMDLLKMVQLEGLASRHPAQLSGGQRQRVALARALAVEPKVLLLDEPFGALDAKVRQELRQWLRHLHDELHITSVFVTHDQEEALEVADRVVVMNQGRIEQIGTPEEVYDKPANPFVYNFLGNVNLFHGRSHDGHVNLSPLNMTEQASEAATAVIGYVRPHDLDVSRQRSGPESIDAVVLYIQTRGPVAHVELRRCDNNETIAASLSRERFRDLNLRSGETVHVTPKNVQYFPEREAEEDYSI